MDIKCNINIKDKKNKKETRKESKESVKLGCIENQKMIFNNTMLFENQDNCIWLSSKDVSKIFSLSENSIRIMVYRNQIKSYKLGRRLRFKYSDIVSLLNKGSTHGD